MRGNPNWHHFSYEFE